MNDTLEKIGVWKLGGYFEFLDDLRASGAVNMFGATPVLRRKHRGELKEDEARAVMSAWMKTFKRDKSPEERAKEALA